MKRLTKDNLPNSFDENTIEILAKMSNEIPQSKEWYDIFEIISEEIYRKIANKAFELKIFESKLKWDSLSKEQEEIELKKREESVNSSKFSGNMGEAEAELGKDKKPKLP
jgi:hypothetical protein